MVSLPKATPTGHTMATITVTAMDDGGMSAMQMINVTVNPANMQGGGTAEL
jgi:hypothetical protein